MSGISEPLREMASALVDGEASEFERRRVLEGMDADVRDLLSRHYLLRAVLRREATVLCPPALTRSMLDALDAEAAPASAAGTARWRGWAAGAAVAASVCFMTVVGARFYLAGEQSEAGAPVAGALAVGDLGAPAQRPVPLPGSAVAVGFDSERSRAVERRAQTGLDPDRAAEQRLQMYMVEHAQNAALNASRGMMPFARVVSYEEP